MTPFARLLLFLLFFLPLSYIGASFYNGEDPVANIKKWIGIDEGPKTTTTRVGTPKTEPQPSTTVTQAAEAEEAAIAEQAETAATANTNRPTLEALQREIEQLRKQVEEQQKVIEALQAQVAETQQ